MTGSVTIKARAFNKVNKGRQRKNEESYVRDLSGDRGKHNYNYCITDIEK